MNLRSRITKIMLFGLILSFLTAALVVFFTNQSNQIVKIQASNLIYFPNKSDENVFIFSNQATKEWKSLKELNSEEDLDLTKKINPLETFNVRYNQDTSAFLNNYFSLPTIQNNIQARVENSNLSSTVEKPLFVTKNIGNGYLSIESILGDEQKAKTFNTSVKEEFTNLLKSYNDMQPQEKKIEFNEKFYKSDIFRIKPNQKSLPIAFLSTFLGVFLAGYLIFTLFDNQTKPKNYV
ncbi:MAG: hypothetical protein ACRCXZ_07550 [Patescibacteria group bacterium]